MKKIAEKEFEKSETAVKEATHKEIKKQAKKEKKAVEKTKKMPESAKTIKKLETPKKVNILNSAAAIKLANKII